jgi:hypothetical protein
MLDLLHVCVFALPRLSAPDSSTRSYEIDLCPVRRSHAHALVHVDVCNKCMGSFMNKKSAHACPAPNICAMHSAWNHAFIPQE